MSKTPPSLKWTGGGGVNVAVTTSQAVSVSPRDSRGSEGLHCALCASRALCGAFGRALGIGLLANGSGTITTSNGNYKTSDASGMTYQALFGMEWSGIEGLIGYQSINLEYKGFKNNSDGSTLSTPLSISGGLLLFGFGVHF